MINDLYDVEPQLQAYDPDLYIMWNPHTGEHLIMDGLTELAIMKLPQPGWPTLHSGIVNHIKRIHTGNGFSASAVVEKSDAVRERDVERKKEQVAADFAKDMFNGDKYSVTVKGLGA